MLARFLGRLKEWQKTEKVWNLRFTLNTRPIAHSQKLLDLHLYLPIIHDTGAKRQCLNRPRVLMAGSRTFHSDPTTDKWAQGTTSLCLFALNKTKVLLGYVLKFDGVLFLSKYNHKEIKGFMSETVKIKEANKPCWLNANGANLDSSFSSDKLIKPRDIIKL